VLAFVRGPCNVHGTYLYLSTCLVGYFQAYEGQHKKQRGNLLGKLMRLIVANAPYTDSSRRTVVWKSNHH